MKVIVSVLKDIIELSEKKINTLQALRASLKLFHDNMEEYEAEMILSQLDTQAFYLQQLTAIDKRFYTLTGTTSIRLLSELKNNKAYSDEKNELYGDYVILSTLLDIQNILVSELKTLNKKATEKAQVFFNEVKCRLKNLNHHKSVITNYYEFEKVIPGGFYDYKEKVF